jgi:hypothetical protein
MSDTPDTRTREVLRAHGLPEGLMPEGLSAAEIDPDGRFRLSLPRRVEREIAGYRVRYDTRIEGQLKGSAIEGLKGVDAKQGLWFGVAAIREDAGKLAFQVGPVQVRLSRRHFGG